MYIYRYYFISVYPPAVLSLAFLHPEKAIFILSFYLVTVYYSSIYLSTYFSPYFYRILLSDISVPFQFLFAFVFFAHF